MGTARTGSLGNGCHRYRMPNGFTAQRMGDGRWYVFDCDGNDTGRDFATLREARRHNSARF